MINLQSVKRIVIKIGTSAITQSDGTIDEDFLQRIAAQIESLRKENKEILIVSSGAVGCGMKELSLLQKPRDSKLRQVCAAVGQTNLMVHWKEAFPQSTIAQLLITYDTFSHRKLYVQLQGTLMDLLKRKIIPIINENDPIAIVGADFGDNDRLSALIATKMQADLLIVLSDVEGLYDDQKKLIPVVQEIVNDTFRYVHKSGGLGKGGMARKLEAIKIATSAGIPVVLVRGKTKEVLLDVTHGKKIGTLFLAKDRRSSVKTWLEQTHHHGIVTVDSGAANALKKGKNLLPVGVRKVEGTFDAGEVVAIVCDGMIVAKFRTAFSSKEINVMVASKVKENITKKDNLLVLEHEEKV